MTKDEALDLALEALEKSLPRLAPYGEQDWLDSRAAITAIKQALAAPVQEPVAIALNTGTKQGVKWLKNVEHGVNLYTAQPAPASWMEMVTANLVREGVNKHKARELAEHFYSLAQRQWVGLTDEDKLHIEIMGGKSDVMLAEMVEAKLRSKNNG